MKRFSPERILRMGAAHEALLRLRGRFHARWVDGMPQVRAGIAAGARIALVGLVAVVACGQAPDIQGWGKVRWGMSVAEARAALGSDASDPTERSGPNFKLIEKILVREVKVGDLTAKASIQTARGSDLITAVTLGFGVLRDGISYRSSGFSTLKRLLIEKYGPPKTEDRKPADRGDIESIASWILPSTTITLLWHESPRYDLGYLTLQYQARDKAALDVL